MEAKELRIGNYIQTRHGSIEQVRDILEYGINSETDYYGGMTCEYFESYITGVPLTEEWLVNFGFKEMCLAMDCRWFERGDIKIHNHREYDDNEDCICFDYVGTVLHYVHQLQNLYFALTGEELTIKEK